MVPTQHQILVLRTKILYTKLNYSKKSVVSQLGLYMRHYLSVHSLNSPMVAPSTAGFALLLPLVIAHAVILY